MFFLVLFFFLLKISAKVENSSDMHKYFELYFDGVARSIPGKPVPAIAILKLFDSIIFILSFQSASLYHRRNQKRAL